MPDDTFTDKFNPDELPEELKAAYKSMQGDYTKKTTALADERKAMDQLKAEKETLEKQMRELQPHVAKLEEANNKWSNWFDDNFKTPDSLATSTRANVDDDDDVDAGVKPTNLKRGVDGQTVQEREKIEKLELAIKNLDRDLKLTKDESKQQMGFAVQMIELARNKGADFDMEAVVKTAIEKGHTDLERAFQDYYGDDIVEAKAKEKFEEFKKEFEENARKGGAVGSGQGPRETFMKLGPKRHTYAEATEAALEAISKTSGG